MAFGLGQKSRQAFLVIAFESIGHVLNHHVGLGVRHHARGKSGKHVSKTYKQSN